MSLVMEYLPYGSLIGYLEKNQHKVNTQRLLLFASQICKVRVGDASQKINPKILLATFKGEKVRRIIIMVIKSTCDINSQDQWCYMACLLPVVQK